MVIQKLKIQTTIPFHQQINWINTHYTIVYTHLLSEPDYMYHGKQSLKWPSGSTSCLHAFVHSLPLECWLYCTVLKQYNTANTQEEGNARKREDRRWILRAILETTYHDTYNLAQIRGEYKLLYSVYLSNLSTNGRVQQFEFLIFE